MLATFLLSKNLRTQIALPCQWLNSTVNVIRLRSSSSESSSGSDSESDSESCNKTIEESKSYAKASNSTLTDAVMNKRNFDYSYSIKEAHKRRQIEKRLIEAAQVLTTKGGEDKDKILSKLLESITKIQNEKSHSMLHRSNQDKSSLQHQRKLEDINEKSEQENKVKDILPKRKKQEAPSIVRLLDNRHKMAEQKTEATDEPSIIKMLQNQEKKMKTMGTPITKYNKKEEELSIIKMLQNQEINAKTFKKIESRPQNLNTNEPSIIKTLQRQQEKANIDIKMTETKYQEQKEPSIIRMLQRQQRKARTDSDKFGTKHRAFEEETSIIKTLKDQQTKRDNTDNSAVIKTETKEEPSVIRSLKRRMRMTQINEKVEMQRGIEEINEIITDRHKSSGKYNQIFTNDFLESSNVPELKIWNMCEEKELELMVTRYPDNAFEQMIQWTKEGKLWKFPIDNEQGLEAEQSVHFSKHIFLDRHLAGWCPAKGPIRHFMELVCVGLSKNPHMTIEEKYDHIMWYRDYFKNKSDLLQKLGLIE